LTTGQQAAVQADNAELAWSLTGTRAPRCGSRRPVRSKSASSPGPSISIPSTCHVRQLGTGRQPRRFPSRNASNCVHFASRVAVVVVYRLSRGSLPGQVRATRWQGRWTGSWWGGLRLGGRV